MSARCGMSAETFALHSAVVANVIEARDMLEYEADKLLDARTMTKAERQRIGRRIHDARVKLRTALYKLEEIDGAQVG